MSRISKPKASTVRLRTPTRVASVAALLGLLIHVVTSILSGPGHSDVFSATVSADSSSVHYCAPERGGGPAKDSPHAHCCPFCGPNHNRDGDDLCVEPVTRNIPASQLVIALAVAWSDYDLPLRPLRLAKRGWLSRAPPLFS